LDYILEDRDLDSPLTSDRDGHLRKLAISERLIFGVKTRHNFCKSSLYSTAFSKKVSKV